MILFEKTGTENTKETLRIAIEKAMQLNTQLVVATTRGQTGVLAGEMAKQMGFGNKIVAVTHVHGSFVAGEDPIEVPNRARMAQNGVVTVTATHVLSGIERAISGMAQGMYPAEIAANTLRMFGAGTKVVVECAVMALDAGAIDYGKPIVAVGGTGRGADTAAVLTPAHGKALFATKIHEILCKPYL